MMDSKMSAAGLISLVNKAANLGSFIFWCIICSWIITFQDFYTCFRRVFRLFSYLLFSSWNHRSRNVSTPERPVCLAMDDDVITGDDVGIVMEKLGLLRAGQRAEEMETLMLSSEYCSFESVETSLGEVREAFEVFDENNDGFIDGGELRSVMSCIGLKGFSEEECRRMIMVFDHNCDGRIDFAEFVNLMEDCCC